MKKLLITALETLVLVIAWLAFMLWLQFLTNWHIGDVNVFAFFGGAFTIPLITLYLNWRRK